MTQTIFLAIAVAWLVYCSLCFIVQAIIASITKESVSTAGLVYIISFLSALVVVLARG